MDAVRPLAIGVVGHEQQNLMTMIDIIEVHVLLDFSKREHSWSLNRVGLKTENPRDDHI